MGQLQDIRHRLRQLKALEGPFETVDFTTPPETPQALFLEWLETAMAADIIEPHAMTLSTVDEAGWPDARVLILKNVDDRGWHFALNTRSPKGRQIEAQPMVALTFYWHKLGRQVRIRGRACAAGSNECAEDFLARSEDARAGVLLGRQSTPLFRPQDIGTAMAETRQQMKSRPGFIAPEWCVYIVDPLQVEFWQGATDRLHQRLRFHRNNLSEGWEKQRLWP